MQSVTYTIARPDTGAVLPYAVVTVYQQGGSARASLFDATGASIGNPLTADANGAINFAVANGTYVLRAMSADGNLTLPDLAVQIFDLDALATAIAAGSLAGVVGAKYATKANRDADLAKDDGTIALVYADSEPLNNDLSYKIGASGSGSWSAPLGLMAGLSAAYAARAALSVPFLLRSDLIAAPGGTDGYSATVTADSATHTAVSGEAALGGSAATVGAAIPNNGRYTRVSGAWLRTGDLDSQKAEAAADEVAEFGVRPRIFEPRIVPGRNDDASNGVPILRTPDGKALLRAAPVSLIGRVETTETGLSSLQALVGPAPLRVETFEPRIVPGRSSADTPLVRTPSGKALIWRTAQDNTAINALTARVDRTLDSHGMPMRPMYGEWYLRRARAKFQALAAGIAGTQMAIYLPGDSWIDNVAYSGRVFASRLRAAYGNAAIGWVGFGPQPLDSNFWTTSSGTWAVVDETAASPDIYAVTSGTPGSQRVINASSLAAVPTGAKLQWKGTADGVIRYRTGAGPWTTLDVQGSGIQHADLVNLPTGPSWSMTFEVVSGSVDLRGVIFAGTTSGVIIHKGGNNGSTTADWAGVERAEYIASIAQLPIDLAIIPFGVNDQGAGLSDTTFLANTLEIIDRVRTAHPSTGGQPGPDILVSIPPELKARLAAGNSMMPYFRAMLNAADEHRFAVVGLPFAFGPVPADYDAWMDVDLIHPAPVARDPLTLASNLITRTWCEAIGAAKAI